MKGKLGILFFFILFTRMSVQSTRISFLNTTPSIAIWTRFHFFSVSVSISHLYRISSFSSHDCVRVCVRVTVHSYLTCFDRNDWHTWNRLMGHTHGKCFEIRLRGVWLITTKLEFFWLLILLATRTRLVDRVSLLSLLSLLLW